MHCLRHEAFSNPRTTRSMMKRRRKKRTMRKKWRKRAKKSLRKRMHQSKNPIRLLIHLPNSVTRGGRLNRKKKLSLQPQYSKALLFKKN